MGAKCVRPHLYVQLQDVRLRLQQHAHVWFSSAEVSVNELLYVSEVVLSLFFHDWVKLTAVQQPFI